jgi:hypothetical protein
MARLDMTNAKAELVGSGFLLLDAERVDDRVNAGAGRPV